MKRYIPDFVVIALAAALFGLGFFMRAHAAEPGPPCLPREAGGIGTEFMVVDHPDDKAVIYTYQCGDRPFFVIGLYEWKPLRPAPTDPAKLAVELKRLAALHRDSGPAKLRDLPHRAEEQRRLYQPPPAEAFKQRTKVRNI